MGIKNLLQLLRPVEIPVTLSAFNGKRVGVDAMCWLHRGAVACALELATHKRSERYVDFFMKMVRLLVAHDVEPLIVFDGAPLPAKSTETGQRKCRRLEASTKLEKLLAAPDKDEVEVQRLAVEAIQVTPGMVAQVKKKLREVDIEYITAPFEADAQLAYLCRTGHVACVISEDSDLLAYCCPAVIFKLDKFGRGRLVDLSSVLQPAHSLTTETQTIGSMENDPENVVSHPPESGFERVQQSPNQPIDGINNQESALGPAADNRDGVALLETLRQMTAEQFTAACVLAGSDYTADVHINGLGVKTAFKLIRRFRSLDGVMEHLRRDNKWRLKQGTSQAMSPRKIRRRYASAATVFTHHWVVDQQNRCITNLAMSNEVKPPTGCNLIELVGEMPNYDDIDMFRKSRLPAQSSRKDDGVGESIPCAPSPSMFDKHQISSVETSTFTWRSRKTARDPPPGQLEDMSGKPTSRVHEARIEPLRLVSETSGHLFNSESPNVKDKIVRPAVRNNKRPADENADRVFKRSRTDQAAAKWKPKNVVDKRRDCDLFARFY